MDLTDYIAGEFKAGELILIAEALGLAPTSQWGSRKIIDAIRIRLKKAGVPKVGPDDERQRQLLGEFLYVDHWVDENGKVVEEGGVKYPDTVEEFIEANDDVKEVKKCYGFADDADPACGKCKLYVYCAEERIAALPPCYGVLYGPSEVECVACLEARYCKTSNS